jgi:hypothetical protein
VIENDTTSLSAAFDILLEEIEAEIEFVNQIGARAFESRDYDKAREALERVEWITGFRDKADSLRREWESHISNEVDEEGSETHAAHRNLGRLQRGSRTREEIYYRPILETLQRHGGSAPIGIVLDGVLRSMTDVLKPVDYEPLASDPEMPRWKNAAQWARYSLVKEGLLRKDSPRGVWQISEAGIRYLERNFVS